jgi:hypothetical protein
MSGSPEPDTGDEDVVEARLPASIATAVIALLYLTLPAAVSPGPRLVFPILILLVLVPMTIAAPTVHERQSPRLRYVALALLALVVLFNVAALVTIVDALFTGNQLSGVPLLRAGATIWLTNVIIFGLVYWELDAGGPMRRARGFVPSDWLFPQQSDMRDLLPNWRPLFTDYLFVSLMNATAFSPTDAMPISGRAKLVTGALSIVSLVIVVLVTARAVNILR